jgi:hypothetical protein
MTEGDVVMVVDGTIDLGGSSSGQLPWPWREMVKNETSVRACGFHGGEGGSAAKSHHDDGNAAASYSPLIVALPSHS